MTTYNTTAKRWELGWELYVDGVGVTQCRTLATAEATVREFVACDLDLEDEYGFDVTVTPELDPALATETEAAREAQRQVEQARHEAAVRTRKAVRDLKAAGLSGSDVATMLGVSTQRVSQLVRS
jgi:DNA-directed RNA polymerase specialized sigma24 family protein